MTDIENQFDILSNFYLTYKDDSSIKDFIDFNDIGLPLAFLVSEELCEPTELALIYVQETFAMLLDTMGLKDIGFKDLDHLMSTAEKSGKSK
jgi:hypothetical protein